jgi:hypothetical protein
MTRQLPRRSFLKALAAAPALAQKVAEEAVGATVEAAATTTIAEAAVPSILPGGFGKKMELVALANAGMLPDWVKRQAMLNSSYYDRRLEPDVACLQSVALSVKIRMSADRRLERAWGRFEQETLDQKMMAEFMGWPQ